MKKGGRARPQMLHGKWENEGPAGTNAGAAEQCENGSFIDDDCIAPAIYRLTTKPLIKIHRLSLEGRIFQIGKGRHGQARLPMRQEDCLDQQPCVKKELR